MDLLEQHEAFLRVIFDEPADDSPRMVYADFLEELGQTDLAQFIRLDCERSRSPEKNSELERWIAVNLGLDNLRGQNQPGWPWNYAESFRGFPWPSVQTLVTVAQLLDPTAFREFIVKERPHYYASEELLLTGGPITSAEPFESLFGLSAFTRINSLKLEGAKIETQDPDYPQLSEYRLVPIITSAGVQALVRHRGMRRLTSLILTNNNLDNDAALALVKSPYLENLKRLDLFEGNRFRGRVWQQVIERFGEDVVG